MATKKEMKGIEGTSQKRRHLRRGFTTGALCCSGCGRGGNIFDPPGSYRRNNHRPAGMNGVKFRINECAFDLSHACCSVIKDAGDDPDITQGAIIRAEAWRSGLAGIMIRGGEGIGNRNQARTAVKIGDRPSILHRGV
jgi:cobalt-precorrin-5B (C1)-methyltransferase